VVLLQLIHEVPAKKYPEAHDVQAVALVHVKQLAEQVAQAKVLGKKKPVLHVRQIVLRALL
jgi:hypothetical protein